ncbi:DJ-1 family glyoxalase III [Spirochaeta cellobiosiphila]|uniref:DJ-1 family glyoxalase III n=1 Tax=Spirochaeta cellobiosiphila TaxID=504483 RepID=UPI00041B78E9|nr:DJ-1 family glyoxalase III [Spirochaeta cellobiosiphila]
MKTVAVLLAPGFEEVEAITPIDFLRRAGIRVIIVGVEASHIVGSRGVSLHADVLLDELPDGVDGLVLPGGMPGATNLSLNDKVLDIIEKYWKENKLVAAICAAPAVVLNKVGLLEGRQFTCYPGFEEGLEGDFSQDSVVVDNNLITSRGPGTAAAFSEKIIEYLLHVDKADNVHQTTLQMW